MKFSLDQRWLGLLPYTDSLELQAFEADRIRDSHSGVLLGVEHPSTITLGKRANPTLDLKKTIPALEEDGIYTVHIDRGGEAVLHSPGQLVIYPILPIRNWNLGVQDYVNLLEESTIQLLRKY